MKAPSRVPRRVGTIALLSAVFVLATAIEASALSKVADGGTWQTNGKVFATAQYGGVLFIGGEFTQLLDANGGSPIAVQNLAAVDMATGAGIAAFHPAVTGNAAQEAQVQALGVDGNRLYVGGQYSAIDGQSHYNLAAVGIDPGTFAGTVDGGFNATVGTPGVGNEASFIVYKVLPTADGAFVGGAFAKVDGVARSNIAKVKTDGSLDSGWKVAGVNANVRDIEFGAGGTLFVAGAFSAPQQSIVRVSAADGSLDTWAIPAGGVITGDSSDPGMTCWDIVPSGTRLFAACGRQSNYIAAFRLDHGNTGDRVWLFNLVGNPYALSVLPGSMGLAFGGHFGTFLKQKVCGGKLLKNLGILKNVFAAKPKINCNFRPNFEGNNPFGGVWEIQSNATQLWAGGEFTTIANVQHRGLARFTL